MTVPKSKRGVSSLQFFHDAFRIADEITRLLIRDFGVKSISRDLSTYTHNAKMNQEDRIAFTELCMKYHIDVESEFPLWLVDYYRNWIMKALREMIDNLVQANTIYPSGEFLEVELKMRREYQYKAIGNCYQVKQALMMAGRSLPVDYQKFMPYIEKLDNEILAIKAWKKTDKKRFHR